MADVDGIENGLRAASLGCDWVGTTLFGYTEATSGERPPGLSLLPELRHQLKTSVRLICEGGIASPAQPARLSRPERTMSLLERRSLEWICRWLPAEAWPADHIIPACPCRPSLPFQACPCRPIHPCRPSDRHHLQGLVPVARACRRSTSVVISSDAMETASEGQDAPPWLHPRFRSPGSSSYDQRVEALAALRMAEMTTSPLRPAFVAIW